MPIRRGCSDGQQSHTAHTMCDAEDADVVPPGGVGGGTVPDALGSSSDDVQASELHPHLSQSQFGHYGGGPPFGLNEASAATVKTITPQTISGASHTGNVGAYDADLAVQHYRNFSSRVLLDDDNVSVSIVSCAQHNSPSRGQASQEINSKTTAALALFATSPATSLSPSCEGMCHATVQKPTSGGDDTLPASAGAAHTGLLSTANALDVAIDRGIGVRSASVFDGAEVDGVKGDPFVNALLYSRGERGGRGSRRAAPLNGSADGDNGDDDGSAVLQAAVNAAERFDDLLSEDDVVGGRGLKHGCHGTRGTCLSDLLRGAEKDAGGDDVVGHSCTRNTEPVLVSPVDKLSLCSGEGGGGADGGTHDPPRLPSGDSHLDKKCSRLGAASACQRTHGPADDTLYGTLVSPRLPHLASSDGVGVGPSTPLMRPWPSHISSASTSKVPVAASVPPGYASVHTKRQQQQRCSHPAAGAATAAHHVPISPPSSISQQSFSLSRPSSAGGAQHMGPSQLQQPRRDHSQCFPSASPSPTDHRAPPIPIAPTFSGGGVTEIVPQGEVGSIHYVSLPQASIAAAHHQPSLGGASMGGSAILQNSTDASFTAASGMVDGVTAVGAAAQAPSSSLLPSPRLQPFYLYQVPQATMAVEPQRSQGGTNMLLYHTSQACVAPGHVVGHLSPVLQSTAASTAALGDATQFSLTSPPGSSYCLSSVVQQQQQQQIIGGYTVKSSPKAAAAVLVAAAAAATSSSSSSLSEEADRALRNVYLRNLPHSWNTSMLRDLCSRYGTVLSAKVVHHPTTNKSLGYGFVLFEQRASAATCMAMLNQAHLYTENEEPRVLLVRMAHATAAPGFQEEGPGDISAACGFRPPTESTSLLSSGSTASGGGGMPPLSILQQQQEQPTRELRSPCPPMSPSASMMLLSPVSVPQLSGFELPGTVMGDLYGVQGHRHQSGDGNNVSADTSAVTSVPGGDSLLCSSPVSGAANRSGVSASRTALPHTLSETRAFIPGMGSVATAAAEPTPPGLYRDPSLIATKPHLRTHQAYQLQLLQHHPQQQPQPQEGSVAYSSTSATIPVTAGVAVTATAMSATPSQCTGYGFNSPLSLSPDDTASLMLLSSSIPLLPVSPAQSLQPPSASPSSNESSMRPAHAGSSAANMSTRNIYITNIPLTWNTTKLRELCSPFGEIVSASVAHHPQTNESRGYGFVLFVDERDAASCVRTLHQYHVPNSSNILSCRFAKDKATPSIAYTMLSSPPHETGLDSLNSGCGSPAGSLALSRRHPADVSSQNTAAVSSLRGDADATHEIIEGDRAGHSGRVSCGGMDAVCMPIEVFSTMHQRVYAQCAHYLAQQQQPHRQGAEKEMEPTSAEAMAGIQSDAVEQMMQSCVVYGAYVPTRGFGCVRPMDCRRASLRLTVNRPTTAAAAGAVEGAAHPFGGGSPDFSSAASPERQTVGSVLSPGGGNPRREIARDADMAVPETLSATVVCTHAIPVDRVAPVSAAVAALATIPSASTAGSNATAEPPHRVWAPDAERVQRCSLSEVSASPFASPALWFTCTLFTNPTAAMAFVREAAKATLDLGGSVRPDCDDMSRSWGGDVSASSMQFSVSGKDLPQATTPSPPPFSVEATGHSMRFGLRDQVMVLHGAPPVVSSTSLTNTMTAHGARPQLTEELSSSPFPGSEYQKQQQQQQQRQRWLYQQKQPQLHLHSPRMPTSRVPSYSFAGSDNSTASTTHIGDTKLTSLSGLTAALGHPPAVLLDSAQQIAQLSYPQPMLGPQSSVDMHIGSSLSDNLHYAYPLSTVSSSTAGAPLANSIAMMMVMDDSGTGSALPMSIQTGFSTSVPPSAAGWYSSAAALAADCLVGSPVSPTSATSASVHLLANSTTPPLAATLNIPCVSSGYSMINSSDAPGRSRGPQAATARVKLFGSPTRTAPTPSSSPSLLSLGEAPPRPPPPASSTRSLGHVLYTVPDDVRLSAQTTGGVVDGFQCRPHSP